MSSRTTTVSTVPLAKTTRRPDDEASSAAEREEIAALIRRSLESVGSNPLESLELARDAVRRAQEIRDIGIEAEALIAEGEACYRLGRTDEHIACCDRAEELAPDIPDLLLRGRIFQKVGKTHRLRGERRDALRCHRAAFEIFRTLNQPAAQALAIESMGHVHLGRGKYDLTLSCYLRALRIRERGGDPFRIAVLLLNIGNVYGMLHDFTTACDYFRRCLELSRPLHNRTLTAMAEGALGGCYVESGAPHDGLPMIRHALATLIDLNEIDLAIDMMFNVGVAYERLEDYPRALEFYRKALAEAKLYDLPPALLFTLTSMGKVYQRLGDFRSAFACYRKAFKAYHQGSANDRLNVHIHLAELFVLTSDYRRALDHRKKQGELQDKILGTAPQRAIAAVEMRHVLLTTGRHEKTLEKRAEQAERDVDAKARELNSIVLNLTRRDEALKAIRDFLKPLSREARGKTREIMKQILSDISSALDAHGECRVAEEQFELVHQDLLQRLSRHCARLTPSELRICVLIRLNLSIKQIADTLFASELTIRTHRKHIRRKLGLAPTENLASTLLAI